MLRQFTVAVILLLYPAAEGRTEAPVNINSNVNSNINSKNVLFLSLYQIDLPANTIAVTAIQEEFRHLKDITLSLYYEYLDSNRFTDPAYNDALFDLYERKYRGMTIDLIIVSDPKMLDIWLSRRQTILPDTPVIFYDTSSMRIPSLHLPPDVTGVASEVDFVRCVRWFLDVRPSVSEIVMVHGAGRMDQPYLLHIEALRKALHGRVKLTDWSEIPMAEMKVRAAALPKTSVILYSLLFEDAAGVRYRPIDALRELASVASVPVLSGYDHFIGTGTIGGYMYSIEFQAREAAQMGLRILGGKPVSRIPVKTDQGSRFIFDHSALQRYNIPLSSLPPDSIIKNRQYSVWELYRSEITAIIIGFGLLLILLVFLFRLTHQLRRTRSALSLLNENLEKQVEERTAELRRAYKTLQERETLFHSMFDSHSAVMLLISPETGRIILANRSACKYYGYTAEEFETLTIYQINQSGKAEIVSEMTTACAKKQNVFNFCHRLSNGKIRYVEVHSSPIPFKEQNILFSIIHDITSRKLAEDALNRAKEAAEAATLAKSEFLAGMSHEIRTPMNTIVNMSRLLLETDTDSRQSSYARMIAASSDILLALINDILDFSKIEAGKMDLETRAFDLTEVIETVIKILGLKADEKGLELSYRIDDDVHLHLGGDPTRLRQILLNLVNNAVKFTEKGKIEIRVRGEGYGVRGEGKPLTSNLVPLTFEVSDTGIGIPEDRLDRLFKAFSQADSSITRKYGGTGLGLSISKKLAEMMGGEIGVESEEGVGSTFRFTAVFEKRSEVRGQRSEAEKPRTSNPEPRTSNLPPARILLVEDNLFNQQVALALLEKYGLSADIADNGKKAVRILETSLYDLVLMDIEMPEMSGVEVTEIIRKSGSENRNVPMIAMTANAVRGERERYLAAGMNDYVVKPIDPDELAAAIRRQLGSGVRGERSEVRGEGSPLTPNPEPRTSADIFDPHDFLDRLGGNKTLLGKLLKDLPQYLSETVGNLKSAAETNNVNKIKFYAHTIKGMTANVSARRLSQAASEIEMSLKQSSTDIPHSLIGRLEQEAERLQSLLTAQFPDIFTYREAPRTDNVSEIISEETKARLPEIIYRLEHEFLPVWKELCAVYYVDDIEAFAAKIGQFACEFHIGFLADYSKRLSEQVKCCNIIEMEKLMTEFQELVQKIIR